MVIYRCPRGHTKGEHDFAKLMVGEPSCGACLRLGWPISFMEKMEVVRAPKSSTTLSKKHEPQDVTPKREPKAEPRQGKRYITF